MRLIALRQALRLRPPLVSQIRRAYNGVGGPGPLPAYFQPPPKPPRRYLRTILFGTTCIALGAYGHSWLYGFDEAQIEGALAQGEEAIQEALGAAVQIATATGCPRLTLEVCQDLLLSQSGYSVARKAVAHTAQLASNLPCEDTWSCGAYTLFNDPDKDWYEWAVFDGHAGPCTAHMLKHALPGSVGEDLWRAKCFDRPYIPGDPYIEEQIKKAFKSIDDTLIENGLKHVKEGMEDRTQILSAAAPSFSGSCALFALYDPVRHVLRVANTGDSRAVLGRWDPASKRYIAHAMSTDQTGFNPDEVTRVAREHPGEDVIDPETGRVHGLAVTRAFGDARWKWPNEITQRAHDLFWGPRPRPNDVIKTPPYLTAEPEVTDIRVQTEGHPDFLIMATDGLWDNMSSQDAVTCVQMWLDYYKPTGFLEQAKTSIRSLLNWDIKTTAGFPKQLFPKSDDASGDDGGDEDTYFDEKEQCLKWRVSPKHFIVEDENCGVHMIKNALGGKRRELFTGIMTVQPPLSRNVRDDITVHVVFFGVDTQDMIKN